MTEGMPARAWAGSTRRSRLPSNWTQLRRKVLTRDKGLCQIRTLGTCTHRATDVDHIAPGDDHSLPNLQAACSPCHRLKSSTEGHAARPRLTRTPEPHPGLR